MATRPPLPPEAWAVAVACLPAMGPARLLALLRAWPPEAAWRRVTTGDVLGDATVASACGTRARDLVADWRAAAGRLDPAEVWRAHADAGVVTTVLGHVGYPSALADDLEPPGVLFLRGDPGALDAPRVAIVGTRRCTRYGAEIAFEFGRELASAGVAVVSGLALGIDGAGHAGALSVAEGAPPIAVVGSGHDVVYPRRHGPLWRQVEARGVILSEAPLGARPERWRFPARNRVIAALADVVVIVESHEHGGSMHTVTEAVRRDRTVMAVPGPVRSPASAGANRLIADGATPACNADDVLLALGLSPAAGRPVRTESRPPPDDDGRAVLDALGWEAATVDQLAVRTGIALGALALVVTRLEAQGWVARRGAWLERVAKEV